MQSEFISGELISAKLPLLLMLEEIITKDLNSKRMDRMN
jgi:hypothetical protein